MSSQVPEDPTCEKSVVLVKRIVVIRLARRGLPHADVCALCDQAPEDLQHLLVSCSFSRQDWHEILSCPRPLCRRRRWPSRIGGTTRACTPPTLIATGSPPSSCSPPGDYETTVTVASSMGKDLVSRASSKRPRKTLIGGPGRAP